MPICTYVAMPLLILNDMTEEYVVHHMNSQLLLWSWNVADCSLVHNLIAKKLMLPTFL